MTETRTTSLPTDPRALRVRRGLIEMALRRAQPGSGSTPTFLRTRTWSEPSVNLHDLRTPFVVVGAVATFLYMPERVTGDTDILIRGTDAAKLYDELIAAGCTREFTLTIGGSGWRCPTGDLDVVESSEPWTEDAVTNPNRSPTGLPVIRLPYLVILKLAASRSIDVGDLSRMLGQADEATLAEVRAVVRTYRPDDVEDVESLIALGLLELEQGPLMRTREQER